MIDKLLLKQLLKVSTRGTIICPVCKVENTNKVGTERKYCKNCKVNLEIVREIIAERGRKCH